MTRLMLIAACALGCAACSDGPSEPRTEAVVVREMILVDDEGTYTFSHTDHWHGAPVVREGAAAGHDLHFTSIRPSAGDHDMPPIEEWFTLENYPDHSVRVIIEDTTIARWTGDRVRGDLHGVREGASRMTFVVVRGSTTIYEAPPLNFRVQPPLP